MRLSTFLTVFLISGLFLSPTQAQDLEALPIKNLSLPESLGKIDSRSEAASERWVIHIQDVHAHLTAQENIAAIVEHLAEHYQIKTIALEGNWASTRLPKTWGLPSSMEKRNLLRALLEEDYITGPVHAAVFSKDPLTLVGIEDPELYEQNRQLFLKFLEKQDDTLEKISALQKSFQASKENIYNPDFLNFDDALTAYQNGKNLEEFLPHLLQWAKQKEVDLADLADLQIYIQAEEIRKSLDKTKLEDEAKRLIASFKYENLSFDDLLKSGKIPDEKIQHYPQTRKYLDYQKIQTNLSHKSFFDAVDQAILRVEGKLIHTSDERELHQRDKALALAKKIMILQASSSDLAAFNGMRPALEGDLQTSGLMEALENGLKFYELAQKRDQIFFEKITNDPLLQGNIAVVTGGFHTEGLSTQLENAGISHIVISPSLGEKTLPADENLYHQRIREIQPQTQALSELGGRITNAFDSALLYGVHFLKKNRDQKKAVDAVLSFQESSSSGKSTLVETKSSQPESLEDKIESYLDLQPGPQKIVGVLRQSVLRKFLENKNDSTARTLWHQMLTNKANTIILIKDEEDVFTDRVGKASVKIIPGDLEKIVGKELEKISNGKKIGVIDDGFQSQDPRIVKLPALEGSLLILRPALENSQELSFWNDRNIAMIQAILRSLLIRRHILEAA